LWKLVVEGRIEESGVAWEKKRKMLFEWENRGRFWLSGRIEEDVG
jgi:hypothetical protein